jgi:undecaprenyl-diphosphatase
MLERLMEVDRKVFLYLNSLHHPNLDQLMYYTTDKLVSMPLYLLLLFLIIKYFRNDSWAPLLGIIFTIVLADQVASTVMKPLFHRLRPSRDPALEGMVHVVNNYFGAKYGFASSHAANTLGASIFFWKLFKDKTRWIALLFAWSALVSYSRIYLGVHYPGDVLAGFAVGVAAAFAGFKLYEWLMRFTNSDKSLAGKVH